MGVGAEGGGIKETCHEGERRGVLESVECWGWRRGDPQGEADCGYPIVRQGRSLLPFVSGCSISGH